MKLTNLGFNNNLLPVMMLNIIKNAKVSGNIRRTSWLYKRMVKGFFRICDKGDTETAMTYANQFDRMISILNATMGDNWDFDLRPVIEEEKEYYESIDVFKGFEIYLVLRYPEIRITNSKGEAHRIKELFVTLEIIKSEFGGHLCFEGINGTRAYQTYEEWFSGYHHSHLHSNQWVSFTSALTMDSFCLGNNDVVHQRNALMEKWSPEMFEMLVLTLENMVAWESIEGMPYTYFNRIGTGAQVNVGSRNLKQLCEKAYNKIRDRMLSFDVDLYYDGKRYRIKTNNKFERFLHRNIIDSLGNEEGILEKILVIKKAGKFYGYRFPENATKEDMERTFSNSNGELPFFYFRNNEIRYEVEPFGGELPDINKYKVNSNFIDYAARELEKELYYNAVRKCSFEREGQSRDAEGHIAQDQILMSGNSEGRVVGDPIVLVEGDDQGS